MSSTLISTDSTLATKKIEIYSNNSRSFGYRNVSCDGLEEFMSEVHKHLKNQLQHILHTKDYIEIRIFNKTLFRHITDTYAECPHIIEYYIKPKWIQNSSDIDEEYNLMVEEVHKQMLDDLPPPYYSIESFLIAVNFYDLNESLAELHI